MQEKTTMGRDHEQYRSNSNNDITNSNSNDAQTQTLRHAAHILGSLQVDRCALARAALRRWRGRAQSLVQLCLSAPLSDRQQKDKDNEQYSNYSNYLYFNAAKADSAVSLLALVKQVATFVAKLSEAKFMHSFVNRDATAARMAVFNQELASIAQIMSLAIEADAKAWAEEDKEDRKLDLLELENTLQHLVDNDYKILNALELKQVEYFEAIEALQKSLTEQVDKALQQRSIDRLFMERALTCLQRATTNSTDPATQKMRAANLNNGPPPQWVLTSWEVDVGETIARGGFAEVLKATWLSHTPVAIKRLHMRLETEKIRKDFLREVKTWFPLRHPNILPLLGACATSPHPFMVMPFMAKGHSLQYLEWCADTFGRTNLEPKGVQLLYEISLGLQYLHSRSVVHGDLKAVNVLVDSHGVANVSDFGFSTLKQFSSTRASMTRSSDGAIASAAAAPSNFGGTLRWMSPERLQGGHLTPPVDVYAYAMTCYEILSEGEVPLTEIPDVLLFQHVVNLHTRPAMPKEHVYVNSGEALYRIMQTCWDPNPLARPTFSNLAINIKSIVGEVRGKQRAVAGGAGEDAVGTGGGDDGNSLSDGGGNENGAKIGGGLLRSVGQEKQLEMFGRTSKRKPQILGREDNPDEINIQFEPETWGSLVNDLLPIFSRSQRAQIKNDILLLGRELSNPIVEIPVSAPPSELNDFLYNLKISAGYETSTVRFIEYMQHPSKTRAEQTVKASIHIALSKLGTKEGERMTVGGVAIPLRNSDSTIVYVGGGTGSRNAIIALAASVGALKFELQSAPPGGNRRCVKQYLTADTLVVGHYEVGSDSQSYQRIDVEASFVARLFTIFDDAPIPSKYYHKNDVQEGSQKFTFNMHETANVHYCFTNTNTMQGYHESMSAARTISIHTDTGAEAEDVSETKKDLTPVERELYRLEHISAQLLAEMDKLKTDEEKMRDVNENFHL
ncbi:hypothetical protein HK100_012112 [Physocladia obscura]|uniref:Protein kinase domain-containing protein n=1 Tax=Physocladia obscura TaxID=109957 RepID=A0AAD5XG58_9FUNG|nr:hypothetical protein HK100_012112 [Physocladia obscura]